MDSLTKELPIDGLLQDIYKKTDARNYADALAILETARSLDPGNIYISALKRQLESLHSLDGSNELSEGRRLELTEPMPAIIECALRDAHRQSRTGVTTPPLTQQASFSSEEMHGPAQPGTTSPAHHEPQPVTNEDAKKELEALKLLYFQRASKFVMKGEYEQALAEVQRVFVVDPENTIAKEYAARVENLIEHARQLASEPDNEDLTVSTRSDSDPALSLEPPFASPSAPEDTRHSTAWTDDFESPKKVSPPSERRPATPVSERRPATPVSERRPATPVSERRHGTPVSERRHGTSVSERRPGTPLSERHPGHPSSKNTIEYGDSLADVLDHIGDSTPGSEARKPDRSRTTLLLVAAIVLLLLGGGTVIVLSSMRASTGGTSVAEVRQRQDAGLTTQVFATVAAPAQELEQSSQQETPVQQMEHSPSASTPVAQPVAGSKLKADVSTVKTEPTSLANPGTPSRTAQQEAVTLQQSTQNPLATEQPLSPGSAPTVAEAAPVEVPAFVAVEKQPQIIKLEKPQFPSFVWNTVSEGQVVVRVLIDPDGKPIDTQVLKSTNGAFEDAVIEAVMKSQFTPAQMGQGPVSAWLTIPFRFKQPK